MQKMDSNVPPSLLHIMMCISVARRAVLPQLSRMRPSCIVAATFVLAAAPLHARAQQPQWYRGNTHVHTTNSDGNETPAVVARWYREHGYAFVVITDHERITDVAPLNATLAVRDSFLVMVGQEITQQVVDSTRLATPRQAHVVAIGLASAIMPLGDRGIVAGTSIEQTYRRNLGLVRDAGALPQVNHPNFKWSVRPDDMASLPDSTLFEVWNGEPRINNLGGEDDEGHIALSTEALWDTLLTRGRLLYGVAADDAHKFKPDQLQDFEATRPGGAWVMVRARELSPSAIMQALRAGDFYASNGVRLADYRATAKDIHVVVTPPENARDDRRYRTMFIGRGGRVLASVPGFDARYTIRGDEGYVRAVVVDSNGKRAWMQPVRISR
jgi:hypothetical protein